MEAASVAALLPTPSCEGLVPCKSSNPPLSQRHADARNPAISICLPAVPAIRALSLTLVMGLRIKKKLAQAGGVKRARPSSKCVHADRELCASLHSAFLHPKLRHTARRIWCWGSFSSPLAYERPIQPCSHKQSMCRADVQKLAQYPVTATLRKASIIPRPTVSLCTP